MWGRLRLPRGQRSPKDVQGHSSDHLLLLLLLLLLVVVVAMVMTWMLNYVINIIVDRRRYLTQRLPVCLRRQHYGK